MQRKRILIMAGGTGGHVFPALAVARSLNKEGIETHWMGTARGLEADVVPAAAIPLSTITVTGLRGKSVSTLLIAPFKLFQSFFQALRIIRKFRPDAVLGMGGYVSGPGGIAAWLLGIPLYIHEQNAIAGLTNKILAPLACVIMQAFPETFQKNDKVITTGNPVREDIIALTTETETEGLKPEDLHLLILGGSLGARALNQAVPIALKKLAHKGQLSVWHQTGQNHLLETRNVYKEFGLDNVRVDAFIDDMAAAYKWADVVLCRAGALTLAELCVAGLASILVPYPYAVDDHQTANAKYLSDAGAAVLLPETDLEPGKLAVLIGGLSDFREKIRDMAEKTRQLACLDSAQQVSRICSGGSHV